MKKRICEDAADNQNIYSARLMMLKSRQRAEIEENYP